MKLNIKLCKLHLPKLMNNFTLITKRQHNTVTFINNPVISTVKSIKFTLLIQGNSLLCPAY